MIGLKENVLIGKLIPAGTGMKKYRNVKLDTELTMEEEIMLNEYDDEEFQEEEMVSEVEAFDVTE